MEFSIDVHTGLNGKIIIEDYSREYDQYFSEDETNQEKGKYKYSESKTINVLTKVNSESESKIGDPIIHNHDQLKPDPLYPDNYIYDLEKIKFTIDDDGYYLMHHIVLPTKQWLENTYLTHENEDYRKSYESVYIIDDNNDIFKVSVQQLSINKENRLHKIIKFDSDYNIINTIEYICDENFNVVEIKTSDETYDEPLIETTHLFYDENGLLIKSEKSNGLDINDSNAQWTTVEYIYTDGKLTSYTVKEFTNWRLWQTPHDITNYTLVYEEDNIVEITSTGETYDTWTYGFIEQNPTKISYSYENGKLIKEEKTYAFTWEEPKVYYTNYVIEYEYNEAGNCISATKTDDVQNVTITEYTYDETKLESNVYSFTYPYEVKPINTNIISETCKIHKDSVVAYELFERLKYGYKFATNSKSNYNLKSNKLSYELEPVSIEELYKRNIEGTTIEKCTIDIFYTGYLQHCYINYCNKLFSKLTKNCNDLCIREDHKELIYIRDFLWMVLNIIDYQISFKNYMEAQRLLEITNYCGNFCQNKESYVGSNTRCRCS